MTIPLASAQSLTASNFNTAATIASDAALASQYSDLLSQITTAAGQGRFTITYTTLGGNIPQLKNMLERYGYNITVNDLRMTITWPTSAQISTDNTVAVSGPVTGLNISAFNGSIRTPLTVKFKPAGGVAPYTFTITGNVPAGTAFGTLSNVNSITLTGTPTVASIEYATLNIKVVDSLGQSLSQDIDWSIASGNATVTLS